MPTDEFANRVRYKVILGRFHVTHVEALAYKTIFAIEFPGMGKLVCEGVPGADIKPGDQLTLYTEVLAQDRKVTN